MKKTNNFYVSVIKRVIDFTLAFLGLLLFWWVLLLVALAVRVKLGAPVLFTQERAGMNGKLFRLYKFRSMTDERDENGELLPDEMRLGSFGKKLRATSLDELPSLLNILKGEMALIGPRPLPTRYLKYYTEEESHRHDVRPGITGLAQVNGRNYVSWEDKFRMDLEYVHHASLLMDIKIFFKTIAVVFEHDNIDTGSFIEHEGVIYRPLDVERSEKMQQSKDKEV